MPALLQVLSDLHYPLSAIHLTRASCYLLSSFGLIFLTFFIGCGAATCSVNNSSSADRIHSTDIAFKPNKDGWGYSKRYSNNFEAIFGKKEVTNAATQGEKKIPQNH